MLDKPIALYQSQDGAATISFVSNAELIYRARINVLDIWFFSHEKS
jgi:hypothetical protein